MLDFEILDYIALGWFFLCWICYTYMADRSHWSEKSISVAMNRYRLRWMQTMLRRDDPRIVDTNIQSSLLSGIAFFASTTIIVVGGLVAMLGAGDKAVRVLAELPFVVQPSRTVWEFKLLLLISIFVYAFFKFAWSFRLLKYCSILIGAVPSRADIDKETEAFIERIACMISIEGGHFNLGLRAYFFALAALGWFLHPVTFILATAWVTWVLYRREFRSKALFCLQED
jgi:uncharacterized membrane protein